MVGLDNPLHIVMVLLVVMLLFGAKRLPEIGRSLGTGLRGFKESLTGEEPPMTTGEISSTSGDSKPPAAAE